MFAYFMTSDLVGVLKQQSAGTLWWTYFFGVLWGFGGLTFGLTMRYLGMSLGMGVALGYCAAFGTLLPPVFKAIMPNLPVGASIVDIAKSTAGQVTLAGVGVCLVGIAIAALAGFTKEKEMPEEQKKKVIKEFNFRKGIMVATFSGIMSACFAFALQAGADIRTDALKAGYLQGAVEKGIHVTDQGIIPSAACDQLAGGLNPAMFGLDAGKKFTFGGVLENVETNSAFAATFTANFSNSMNVVGRRVAAYASGFESVRTNAPVAATIKGLGDFSQKELAVGIAMAGGDVVALQKRFGLWQGLPPLVVLLLGGFTTNFLWCVLLNIRNRTGYQYLASHVRAEHAHHGGSGGGEHGPAETASGGPAGDLKIPVFGNYLFPRSRGPAGISSSSFTRWAPRRWANMISPRGRCTWRASSSSAPCGAGFSTNGRAPARRRTCSSPAASPRSCFRPPSSVWVRP